MFQASSAINTRQFSPGASQVWPLEFEIFPWKAMVFSTEMEDAGDKDLGCRCDPTTNPLAFAPDRGAALPWSSPLAVMVSLTPPGSKSGSCPSETCWQQAHPLPDAHVGPWFLDAVLKCPSRKCCHGIEKLVC